MSASPPASIEDAKMGPKICQIYLKIIEIPRPTIFFGKVQNQATKTNPVSESPPDSIEDAKVGPTICQNYKKIKKIPSPTKFV